MTRTSHPRRPAARGFTLRAGFTLTEIMIALAMTALLLIGISKIFALTSATIGAGQATARAMRGQRAVQQTLSDDLLGSGPDIGGATYESGMMPLVNTADADYAAPFLSIGNFRVAAYRNAAELAADAVPPADTTTMSVATFRARSLAIRGIDVNKDGSENTSSILTPGGETVPLYLYGDRNFRSDTLGFFARGRFASQTGEGTSYQNQATSNEAYVWYGHLKVYNSEPNRLDCTNAYGGPGDWLTPDATGVTGPAGSPTTPLPNRNNRFADQFRLGRVQSLLMPAIIPTGQTYPESADDAANANAVAVQAVCAGNDPTNELRFAWRSWWSPTWKPTTGSPPARPSMTPISMSPLINTTALPAGAVPNPANEGIREWYNGQNRVVYSDDRIFGATPAPNTNAVALTAVTSRTDVLGVDLKRYHQRATFAEGNDLTDPLTVNTQSYWWENLPGSWTNRYWVNPFPRTSASADLSTSNTNQAEKTAINAKSLAQRQQLLADNCSQFIVEFAGDFVTQDALGNPTAAQPDGVLDFVIVNNVQQTRWYGMPRDVDGNGSIPGYQNPARINSPDVIPVTDFASTVGAIDNLAATGFANGTALRPPVTPAKPVVRTAAMSDDVYARALGPSRIYTFERTLPPLPPSTTTYDYATAVAEPAGSMDPTGTSYNCVWGPREFSKGRVITALDGTTKTAYPVPQLIRVLADIRDPDGKIKEALTQEYVFPVRITGAIKPPVSN